MKSRRPFSYMGRHAGTRLDAGEFLAATRATDEGWSVLDGAAGQLLVVDLTGEWLDPEHPVAMPVCPVVGVTSAMGSAVGDTGQRIALPEFTDLVVDDEEQLAAVAAVVSASPQAAAVLVQLLRQTQELSVQQGLFAESLAYSTLQHGVEFERWLGQRSAQVDAVSGSASVAGDQVAPGITEPVVLVSREANELKISLNRPQRRNAFSAEMRDLLCEALELALFDEHIEAIGLSGVGSSFCAGGDLAEFGEARDAASAHLSRTTRSAGALLDSLRERVCVTVQGACIGAGIELPAFAGKIHARSDSFFALPEVAFGLVPGAGGCISLPRRIGRHRTALMALSGARIDAEQALKWGLIDKIVDL